MKIWDVFTYWREDWAIKARLRLWETFAPGIEYEAVALVGDRTQRGNPLPAGLPPASDFVRTVEVVLNADSDWGRDAQQRNGVAHLLPEMSYDDIVIIADADELVDPRRIDNIVESASTRPSNLMMSLYYYGPRWRGPGDWWHPFACRPLDLTADNAPGLRIESALPRVENAGWHITYYGDIAQKLAAFPHAEYDTPEWRTLFQQSSLTGMELGGTYQLADDPIPADVAELIGI